MTTHEMRKTMSSYVCACGGWAQFSASEAFSRARFDQHVADVARDEALAAQRAAIDAELKPGESWVYLPAGNVRHIIDGPISFGYSRSRCNRSPRLFSAWLGTGSQKEADKLVALPPCPSCTKGV